ncbi:hypothetical protein [Neorhizobium sp. P12A]|uniref:hypothetical protein n=1 Tax=Neorhizobium sp. P12A TaxID=2268027 RepID=UPI0011EF11E6|nr:hypothetical protein [Neorhizobium sp. P12A]
MFNHVVLDVGADGSVLDEQSFILTDLVLESVKHGGRLVVCFQEIGENGIPGDDVLKFAA